MQVKPFLKFILFICIIFSNRSVKAQLSDKKQSTSANKIVMDLSSFGVESDRYPNIHATIDLINDTGKCYVSYFDTKHCDTSYQLTRQEIDSIRYYTDSLVLRKLKTEYSINWSDQPSSTAIFTFSQDQIKVYDYGLEGDYPLKELYRIIYKLNINIR